ncbi:response regulator transcription factor [Streptacidiphilus sp. EB129]|uniref:helix-turn-helix transcriptional regulator n=1 Tax=Streptacidiphilus sp. EB129 TaxID=3156262 RepID=UPI0035174849
MTLVPMSRTIGAGSGRVRIAITSPDILAQIRQVFASKNLDVEIVRMPYVEVTVRPAAATSADRSAEGTVPLRLVGPASRVGAPASRRLCAEYRLSVVDAGDRPRAEHPVPAGLPHPAPVPDPDVPAHGPVVTLSQRQHEVMALVSRGVRNTEIAARLQVSEKTVKNHINRIFRTLGAGSRVEAVLIWQRQQRDGAPRRDAIQHGATRHGATRHGALNPPPALARAGHPEPGGTP